MSKATNKDSSSPAGGATTNASSKAGKLRVTPEGGLRFVGDGGSGSAKGSGTPASGQAGGEKQKFFATRSADGKWNLLMAPTSDPSRLFLVQPAAGHKFNVSGGGARMESIAPTTTTTTAASSSGGEVSSLSSSLASPSSSTTSNGCVEEKGGEGCAVVEDDLTTPSTSKSISAAHGRSSISPHCSTAASTASFTSPSSTVTTTTTASSPSASPAAGESPTPPEPKRPSFFKSRTSSEREAMKASAPHVVGKKVLSLGRRGASSKSPVNDSAAARKSKKSKSSKSSKSHSSSSSSSHSHSSKLPSSLQESLSQSFSLISVSPEAAAAAAGVADGVVATVSASATTLTTSVTSSASLASPTSCTQSPSSAASGPRMTASSVGSLSPSLSPPQRPQSPLGSSGRDPSPSTPGRPPTTSTPSVMSPPPPAFLTSPPPSNESQSGVTVGPSGSGSSGDVNTGSLPTSETDLNCLKNKGDSGRLSGNEDEANEILDQETHPSACQVSAEKSSAAVFRESPQHSSCDSSKSKTRKDSRCTTDGSAQDIRQRFPVAEEPSQSDVEKEACTRDEAPVSACKTDASPHRSDMSSEKSEETDHVATDLKPLSDSVDGDSLQSFPKPIGGGEKDNAPLCSSSSLDTETKEKYHGDADESMTEGSDVEVRYPRRNSRRSAALYTPSPSETKCRKEGKAKKTADEVSNTVRRKQRASEKRQKAATARTVESGSDTDNYEPLILKVKDPRRLLAMGNAKLDDEGDRSFGALETEKYRGGVSPRERTPEKSDNVISHSDTDIEQQPSKSEELTRTETFGADDESEQMSLKCVEMPTPGEKDPAPASERLENSQNSCDESTMQDKRTPRRRGRSKESSSSRTGPTPEIPVIPEELNKEAMNSDQLPVGKPAKAKPKRKKRRSELQALMDSKRAEEENNAMDIGEPDGERLSNPAEESLFGGLFDETAPSATGEGESSQTSKASSGEINKDDATSQDSVDKETGIGFDKETPPSPTPPAVNVEATDRRECPSASSAGLAELPEPSVSSRGEESSQQVENVSEAAQRGTVSHEDKKHRKTKKKKKKKKLKIVINLGEVRGEVRAEDRTEDWSKDRAEDRTVEGSEDRAEDGSEDRAKDGTEDRTVDRSEDRSEDRTVDGSDVRAEDGPKDRTEDRTEDGSKDRTEDGSEDMAEDGSGDRAEDRTEDRAEDMAKDRTQDGSEDRAEDRTEDRAEYMAKDRTEDGSEDRVKNRAEQKDIQTEVTSGSAPDPPVDNVEATTLESKQQNCEGTEMDVSVPDSTLGSGHPETNAAVGITESTPVNRKYKSKKKKKNRRLKIIFGGQKETATREIPESVAEDSSNSRHQFESDVVSEHQSADSLDSSHNLTGSDHKDLTVQPDSLPVPPPPKKTRKKRLTELEKIIRDQEALLEAERIARCGKEETDSEREAEAEDTPLKDGPDSSSEGNKGDGQIEGVEVDPALPSGSETVAEVSVSPSTEAAKDDSEKTVQEDRQPQVTKIGLKLKKKNKDVSVIPSTETTEDESEHLSNKDDSEKTVQEDRQSLVTKIGLKLKKKNKDVSVIPSTETTEDESEHLSNKDDSEKTVQEDRQPLVTKIGLKLKKKNKDVSVIPSTETTEDESEHLSNKDSQPLVTQIGPQSKTKSTEGSVSPSANDDSGSLLKEDSLPPTTKIGPKSKTKSTDVSLSPATETANDDSEHFPKEDSQPVAEKTGPKIKKKRKRKQKVPTVGIINMPPLRSNIYTDAWTMPPLTSSTDADVTAMPSSLASGTDTDTTLPSLTPGKDTWTVPSLTSDTDARTMPPVATSGNDTDATEPMTDADEATAAPPKPASSEKDSSVPPPLEPPVLLPISGGDTTDDAADTTAGVDPMEFSGSDSDSDSEGKRRRATERYLKSRSFTPAELTALYGTPYVVLERLSDKDVFFMSRRFRNARVSSRSHCSFHCRNRTLAYLCQLKLIECTRAPMGRQDAGEPGKKKRRRKRNKEGVEYDEDGKKKRKKHKEGDEYDEEGNKIKKRRRKKDKEGGDEADEDGKKRKRRRKKADGDGPESISVVTSGSGGTGDTASALPGGVVGRPRAQTLLHGPLPMLAGRGSTHVVRLAPAPARGPTYMLAQPGGQMTQIPGPPGPPRFISLPQGGTTTSGPHQVFTLSSMGMSAMTSSSSASAPTRMMIPPILARPYPGGSSAATNLTTSTSLSNSLREATRNSLAQAISNSLSKNTGGISSSTAPSTTIAGLNSALMSALSGQPVMAASSSGAGQGQGIPKQFFVVQMGDKRVLVPANAISNATPTSTTSTSAASSAPTMAPAALKTLQSLISGSAQLTSTTMASPIPTVVAESLTSGAARPHPPGVPGSMARIVLSGRRPSATATTASAPPLTLGPRFSPSASTLLFANRATRPNQAWTGPRTVLGGSQQQQQQHQQGIRVVISGAGGLTNASRFTVASSRGGVLVASRPPFPGSAGGTSLVRLPQVPPLHRPGKRVMTEEERLRKRARLEKKYPLPPGVTIKTEPETFGYGGDKGKVTQAGAGTRVLMSTGRGGLVNLSQPIPVLSAGGRGGPIIIRQSTSRPGVATPRANSLLGPLIIRVPGPAGVLSSSSASSSSSSSVTVSRAGGASSLLSSTAARMAANVLSLLNSPATTTTTMTTATTRAATSVTASSSVVSTSVTSGSASVRQASALTNSVAVDDDDDAVYIVDSPPPRPPLPPPATTAASTRERRRSSDSGNSVVVVSASANSSSPGVVRSDSPAVVVVPSTSSSVTATSASSSAGADKETNAASSASEAIPTQAVLTSPSVASTSVSSATAAVSTASTTTSSVVSANLSSRSTTITTTTTTAPATNISSSTTTATTTAATTANVSTTATATTSFTLTTTTTTTATTPSTVSTTITTLTPRGSPSPSFLSPSSPMMPSSSSSSSPAVAASSSSRLVSLGAMLARQAAESGSLSSIDTRSLQTERMRRLKEVLSRQMGTHGGAGGDPQRQRAMQALARQLGEGGGRGGKKGTAGGGGGEKAGEEGGSGKEGGGKRGEGREEVRGDRQVGETGDKEGRGGGAEREEDGSGKQGEEGRGDRQLRETGGKERERGVEREVLVVGERDRSRQSGEGGSKEGGGGVGPHQPPADTPSLHNPTPTAPNSAKQRPSESSSESSVIVINDVESDGESADKNPAADDTGDDSHSQRPRRQDAATPGSDQVRRDGVALADSSDDKTNESRSSARSSVREGVENESQHESSRTGDVGNSDPGDDTGGGGGGSLNSSDDVIILDDTPSSSAGGDVSNIRNNVQAGGVAVEETREQDSVRAGHTAANSNTTSRTDDADHTDYSSDKEKKKKKEAAGDKVSADTIPAPDTASSLNSKEDASTSEKRSREEAGTEDSALSSKGDAITSENRGEEAGTDGTFNTGEKSPSPREEGTMGRGGS